MWNEKDTKTVGRRLSLIGLVAIMPYWITLLISIYLGVNYIGPVPIMLGTVPWLFLTYSFRGIEVNFNLVYPIFSSAKLVMSLVTFISIAIFGIVNWYSEFTTILKDVAGYEYFKDVRRAINSLTYGSKKDKMVVATSKISIIVALMGMMLIYFYFLDVFAFLPAFPTAVLIMVIAVLALYFGHRYFKQRLMP